LDAAVDLKPSEDLSSVAWIGGIAGYLRLLDQTRLPSEICYVDCRDVDSVWEAIHWLRVRGAPAIGIAAAYGVLLAYRRGQDTAESVQAFLAAADHLATSRPTAVNLFWALNRLKEAVDPTLVSPEALAERLLVEARAIHDEDRRMCRQIGKLGADLIPDGSTLITHCNAGGLATSEYGTALSILFTCQDQGKSLRVFVDETRPLWQGARLTAFELLARGIPATVICDSMAAHVMQTQRVDAVVVGADRITARGDVANKIGTYGLALAARYHRIPFYVAAPKSTFDLALLDGREIPIEQRNPAEVLQPLGVSVAPEGITAYNPAFDVTPADLITAIVTERALIQPVNESTVRAALA
jgi:methylthioribose-1-phosphate isomerase